MADDEDWVEVVSADHHEIEGDLLTWAGIDLEHPLWDHSLLRDLEMFDGAFVDQDAWEGGMPGQSHVWYTVTTKDPDGLREYIRKWTEDNVREPGET